jgi:hypothetical protein
MLVLKRKEGQWIEITHAKTGDVLRIRLYDVCGGLPGRANLAFDDPTRNFAIQRPERRLGLAAPEPASPHPAADTPPAVA